MKNLLLKIESIFKYKNQFFLLFLSFDSGVFRAIRPIGPLDSDAELDGPAMETLVFQELRAMNDYLECGYQLYF